MGFFDFLKKEKSEEEEELDLQYQIHRIHEVIDDMMEVSEIRQMIMALIGKSPKGEIYKGDGDEYEIKEPIERKAWSWWLEKYLEKGDISADQIQNYLVRYIIKTPSFFKREPRKIK